MQIVPGRNFVILSWSFRSCCPGAVHGENSRRCFSPSQWHGSSTVWFLQCSWAVRSGLSAWPASRQGHTARGNPPASPPAAQWVHSSRWGCAGCSGLGSRCCPGSPGCSPPWPHCPSGWSHRCPSSRPGSESETPGDLCLSGILQEKRWKRSLSTIQTCWNGALIWVSMACLFQEIIILVLPDITRKSWANQRDQ